MSEADQLSRQAQRLNALRRSALQEAALQKLPAGVGGSAASRRGTSVKSVGALQP